MDGPGLSSESRNIIGHNGQGARFAQAVVIGIDFVPGIAADEGWDAADGIGADLGGMGRAVSQACEAWIAPTCTMTVPRPFDIFTHISTNLRRSAKSR